MFKETYKGGVILYDEASNVWGYTISGSPEGFASSLILARQAIDRTLAAETKFERHTAIVDDYWGSPETVTVTSYGLTFARTVNAKGQRQKIDLYRLVEDTPENQERAKAILLLTPEIDEKKRQIQKIRAEFTPYVKRV